MTELTDTAQRKRDARRSAVVALAVGLAPWLGKAYVPQNLSLSSSALIPVTAFMMTLPAIAVHFVPHGRRWIVWTSLAFIALVIPFSRFYSSFVKQVRFEGQHVATYVTGSNMLPTCPCVARDLQIENCIGRAITFDPAQVTGCYPAAEINTRQALLFTSYTMLMMSVGMLIGLIVAPIAAPNRRRGKIFISYSHEDRKYLEELTTMLAPERRGLLLDVWDDRKISPGEDWRESLEAALASAKVAVLLVSSHFLNSEFIMNEELPILLNAAREEGVTLSWICFSACRFKGEEFAHYQALHDKPLDQLDDPERQEVLEEICEKLIAAACGTDQKRR